MSHSTATPTTNNSTTRTDSEEEWHAVIRYIRQCPHVPPSHPAIAAALAGIDRERQRMERDLKLRTKFSSDKKQPEPNKHDSDTVLVGMQPEEKDDELMRMTKKRNGDEVDDGGDEEWQAVDKTTSPTTKNATDTAMAVEPSTTDQHEEDTLAPHVVQLLSNHNVLVSSPLAALFVMVHAALVHLGFECTGVPNDNNNSSQGFAAPIRPLTTFLPAGFGQDAASSCFQLRYRGPQQSHILMVQSSNAGGDAASVVQVAWTAGQGREPAATWEFALHQYFNMESWNTAQAGQGQMPKISPLLHYKHLAQLLHTVVQRLDLEGATTTSGINGVTASKPLYGEAQLPAVHATPAPTNVSSIQPQPLGMTPTQQPTEPGRGYEIPNTLGGAFPGLNGFGGGGQFSGDLAPGGIGGVVVGPPHNNGNDGLVPGNLMGPNHPAFGGGGVGNHHPDQAGFLRPRFDPVGPPPTRPEDFDGNGNGMPQPPHQPAPGEIPNHDHFRPPNTLGSSNRRQNNNRGSHYSGSGSDHMYM